MFYPYDRERVQHVYVVLVLGLSRVAYIKTMGSFLGAALSTVGFHFGVSVFSASFQSGVQGGSRISSEGSVCGSWS